MGQAKCDLAGGRRMADLWPYPMGPNWMTGVLIMTLIKLRNGVMGSLGPFAWEDNAANMPLNPVLHKRGLSSFPFTAPIISFAETPPTQHGVRPGFRFTRRCDVCQFAKRLWLVTHTDTELAP